MNQPNNIRIRHQIWNTTEEPRNRPKRKEEQKDRTSERQRAKHDGRKGSTTEGHNHGGAEWDPIAPPFPAFTLCRLGFGNVGGGGGFRSVK
jgi:hypothetical protein